jgi:hypothetical protein
MKNLKLVVASCLILYVNQVKAMEHEVDAKRVDARTADKSPTDVDVNAQHAKESQVTSHASVNKDAVDKQPEIKTPKQSVSKPTTVNLSKVNGEEAPADKVNSEKKLTENQEQPQGLFLDQDASLQQEKAPDVTKEPASNESSVSNNLFSDMWKSMSDGVNSMFTSVSDMASSLKSFLLQEEPLKTELNKIIQGKGDYSLASPEAKQQAETILENIDEFDEKRSDYMKEYKVKPSSAEFSLPDHFTQDDKTELNENRKTIQKSLEKLEMNLQIPDAKMQQLHANKAKAEQKKETALAKSNAKKETQAQSASASGWLFLGA